MKNTFFVFLTILFVYSCEQEKEPAVLSEDSNSNLRSAYNEGYDKAKKESAETIRKLQKEKDDLQKLRSKEKSELEQILVNENLFFFQDSVRSRLTFEKDVLKKLLVEVHYNDKTVLSKNFEAIYSQPSNKDYHEFYQTLIKAKRYLYKDQLKQRINFFAPLQFEKVHDNICMVVMSGYGFESAPHIFAYFKKENGLYSFINFFDQIYGASYGWMKIEGIYKTHNNEHLMVLKSMGGDGGDQHETLRFIRFNDNYKMDEVYTKYVNYYQDGNKKELTYQIQKPENRILIITSELEPGEDGSYKNITTELDTLKVSFR
jgi:hypothetical protein